MACSSAQMSAGQTSFGRNSWMKAAKKASVASGHGWFKKGESRTLINLFKILRLQVEERLIESRVLYGIKLNQVKLKDELVLLVPREMSWIAVS